MKIVLDSIEFKLITFDGVDMYFQFTAGDDELVIPTSQLPYIQAQIKKAREVLAKLPYATKRCIEEGS